MSQVIHEVDFTMTPTLLNESSIYSVSIAPQVSATSRYAVQLPATTLEGLCGEPRFNDSDINETVERKAPISFNSNFSTSLETLLLTPAHDSSTKQCSRCKTIKPVSGFNRDPTKKTGYQSWCKLCYREHAEKRTQMQPMQRIDSLIKRHCTICKLAKPADDFIKDARRLTGLDARCKECRRKKAVESRHRTAVVALLTCTCCLESKPASELILSSHQSQDGMDIENGRRCRSCYELYKTELMKHRVMQPTVATKCCVRCHVTKASSEFTRDTRKRTGLGSRCKACEAEYCRLKKMRRKEQLHQLQVLVCEDYQQHPQIMCPLLEGLMGEQQDHECVSEIKKEQPACSRSWTATIKPDAGDKTRFHHHHPQQQQGHDVEMWPPQTGCPPEPQLQNSQRKKPQPTIRPRPKACSSAQGERANGMGSAVRLDSESVCAAAHKDDLTPPEDCLGLEGPPQDVGLGCFSQDTAVALGMFCDWAYASRLESATGSGYDYEEGDFDSDCFDLCAAVANDFGDGYTGVSGLLGDLSPAAEGVNKDCQEGDRQEPLNGTTRYTMSPDEQPGNLSLLEHLSMRVSGGGDISEAPMLNLLWGLEDEVQQGREVQQDLNLSSFPEKVHDPMSQVDKWWSKTGAPLGKTGAPLMVGQTLSNHSSHFFSHSHDACNGNETAYPDRGNDNQCFSVGEETLSAPLQKGCKRHRVDEDEAEGKEAEEEEEELSVEVGASEGKGLQQQQRQHQRSFTWMCEVGDEPQPGLSGVSSHCNVTSSRGSLPPLGTDWQQQPLLGRLSPQAGQGPASCCSPSVAFTAGGSPLSPLVVDPCATTSFTTGCHPTAVHSQAAHGGCFESSCGGIFGASENSNDFAVLANMYLYGEQTEMDQQAKVSLDPLLDVSPLALWSRQDKGASG